mmetsp:Transcript_10804/g.14085  ORF Transcript_10804/g.14085 Transcript_10804/m.14085 type:complete len:110 (-) Transcript_10804:30-359(-)
MEQQYYYKLKFDRDILSMGSNWKRSYNQYRAYMCKIIIDEHDIFKQLKNDLIHISYNSYKVEPIIEELETLEDNGDYMTIIELLNNNNIEIELILTKKRRYKKKNNELI